MNFVIGEKFPIDVSSIVYDTCVFQIMSAESAGLIWRIRRPKPNELFDFEHGEIKLGVKKFEKLIFFCVNQQPFAEGDSAFHRGRYVYPKDMYLVRANTEVGMPLYMSVVDERNVLRSLRCINMSREITNYLAELWLLQGSEGGRITNPDEYVKLVHAAYQKYPTAKALMNACEVTHTVAAGNSNRE